MVLAFMHAGVFCYLMVAGLVKNVIIFGADMSLSGQVDDRKDIYLNFW